LDPLVNVTSLHTAWKTPNVIRWEWTVEGKASDWKSYTMSFGTNKDDILAGTAETLNKGQRPELNQFDTRGGKTVGPVSMWAVTEVNGTSFANAPPSRRKNAMLAPRGSAARCFGRTGRFVVKPSASWRWFYLFSWY
jgi:hypothetical protein